MKSKILIILMSFLVSINLAFADGDKHQHSEKKKEHSSHSGHDSIEKDVMIKGQLIGLTCFVKHASKGPTHKDCFKECAEKGLPIGILTKDNKIYQVSGEGHSDLKETNKKFLKYAEEEVMAKGKVFTSNGMNMIVVKGIKKVKE
jgi:hypothetical protein